MKHIYIIHKHTTYQHWRQHHHHHTQHIYTLTQTHTYQTPNENKQNYIMNYTFLEGGLFNLPKRERERFGIYNTLFIYYNHLED